MFDPSRRLAGLAAVLIAGRGARATPIRAAAAFVAARGARAQPIRAVATNASHCRETLGATDCVAGGCAWCASARARGCAPSPEELCPAECVVRGDGAQKTLADLVKSGCDLPSTNTAATDADKPVGLGVGVGFSGGGARAFTASLGWVRALRSLGLWQNTTTITAVSGAAWFHGPFSYSSNGDEDASLGTYVEPADLTLAAVNASAGSLASRPSRTLAECFERFAEAVAAKDAAALERVWTDVVAAAYLTPEGIHDEAFFGSASLKADAAARNPGALDDALVLRNASAPSPIFIGTLEGPASLLPLAHNTTYYQLAMGGQWSGTHGFRDVAYASRRGDSAKIIPVGGFVETWALGAVPVTADGAVALNKKPFSLADAVGVASMAPSRVFGQDLPPVGPGGPGAGFFALVPAIRMWAPDAGLDDAVEPQAVGDGGNLENYGVLHLLQRGHSRIVVFDCSETALSTTWDAFADPPTKGDVDEYIPALFGEPVNYGVEAMEKDDHVFESEGLPRLIQALQAANATGNGAVANVTVTTVANEIYGVEAGRVVDLTFVYLDLPEKWLASLPAETANASLTSKEFRGFPRYSTFFYLALTPSAVSLLAHLCSWVVFQNAELLAEKLAPPP